MNITQDASTELTVPLKLTDLKNDFSAEPAVTASIHFLKGGYFVFEHAGTTKFVTVDDVTAAFSGSKPDSGWLPEGILRHGICARGAFFVYLKHPEKVTIMRNSEKFRIALPYMIVIGVGKKYRILPAKKSSKGWILCHRFLPNTYPDGAVCWGDMSPVEAFPANAEKVWNQYITSAFNNDLTWNEGEQLFTKAVESKEFPLELLKPMDGDSRLDDFINRMVNNYNPYD